MPPPAFSRIALAAALIEYDNDSLPAGETKRVAQQSAIFANLRPTGPVPKPQSVLEYDDLPEPRRSKDYLHVGLPGDGDEASGYARARDTVLENGPPPRRSRDTRRSLDVLRDQGEQYFQGGGSNGSEHESENEEDDVDLTSWGLDSFIPNKPASKGKAVPRPTKRSGPAKMRPASQHLDNLPNPHSPQEMEHDHSLLSYDDGSGPGIVRRPSLGARSHSLFGDEGMKKLFIEHGASLRPDPNTTSAPPTSSTFPFSHNTARRHNTLPMPDEFGDLQSASGPHPALLTPPLRPHSRATVDPTMIPFPDSRPGSALDLLADEDNAFAVPLPPPERLSKFDPKAARHARTMSGGSWVSTDELNDARKRRRHSGASFGSRGMLDEAAAVPLPGDDLDEEDFNRRDPSVMTGLAQAGNRNSQFPHLPPSSARSISHSQDPRRMSRLDMLRPKVLIMPSPLRDKLNYPSDGPNSEGFADSTGDRPLPATFRSSVSVQKLTAGTPVMRPSSSFGMGTPAPAGGLGELLGPANPRASMSASQLMFRHLHTGDSPLVDGGEENHYPPRATQEGEKIEVYEEDPEYVENEYRELYRPTGKLMGKSLMDALEARKAEIRGKRRVFVGDDRPSMMERHSTAVRPSTLIDPTSFNAPQIAVVDNEGRPIKEGEPGNIPGSNRSRPKSGALDRRNSKGPLLNFNEDPSSLSPSASGGRPTGGMKARPSVFGVDTLWEKELGRLEKIKAAEEAERAEEERLMEEEQRKWAASKAGKGKGSRRTSQGAGTLLSPSSSGPVATRPVSSAPVLPDVARVSTSGRPRPQPVDFSDEDDGMGEFGAGNGGANGGGRSTSRQRRRVSTATLGVKGWFAGGSDDEDDASRRTPDSRAITPNSGAVSPIPHPINTHITGSSSFAGGPRGSVSPGVRLPPVLDEGEEDSDDDVPLVAKQSQIRASIAPRRTMPDGDTDSDEDAPLVAVKAKKQQTTGSDPALVASGSGLLSASASAPSLAASPSGVTKPAEDSDDEDNVPLGLRASSMFPSNLQIPSPNPAKSPLSATSPADDDDEDDDEKPLGLRYSIAPPGDANGMTLMQQAQAQQQQAMYMQHMARSSMASFSAMGPFGPMGMGSVGSFMAPQMTGNTMPMGMGMMGMGMGMPMPMQMQAPVAPAPNPADTAKINRVDNWRKGVEGAVPDYV